MDVFLESSKRRRQGFRHQPEIAAERQLDVIVRDPNHLTFGRAPQRLFVLLDAETNRGELCAVRRVPGWLDAVMGCEQAKRVRHAPPVGTPVEVEALQRVGWR